MQRKIKFTKQYKPRGFGDRDDKGSVEAHLRAKAEAREMRQYNAFRYPFGRASIEAKGAGKPAIRKASVPG